MVDPARILTHTSRSKLRDPFASEQKTQEELFRERRRKLVHRSVRRIGWVGLVT